MPFNKTYWKAKPFWGFTNPLRIMDSQFSPLSFKRRKIKRLCCWAHFLLAHCWTYLWLDTVKQYTTICLHICSNDNCVENFSMRNKTLKKRIFKTKWKQREWNSNKSDYFCFFCYKKRIFWVIDVLYLNIGTIAPLLFQFHLEATFSKSFSNCKLLNLSNYDYLNLNLICCREITKYEI